MTTHIPFKLRKYNGAPGNTIYVEAEFIKKYPQLLDIFEQIKWSGLGHFTRREDGSYDFYPSEKYIMPQLAPSHPNARQIYPYKPIV
jgi:hypothetical protein